MSSRDPLSPWRGTPWEAAAEAANHGLNGQGYIVHATMMASRSATRLTYAIVLLMVVQIALVLFPKWPEALRMPHEASTWWLQVFGTFLAFMGSLFLIIAQRPVPGGGWRPTPDAPLQPLVVIRYPRMSWAGLILLCAGFVLQMASVLLQAW
jgi:hypothetical protein